MTDGLLNEGCGFFLFAEKCQGKERNMKFLTFSPPFA
jgi:hypothetical protein